MYSLGRAKDQLSVKYGVIVRLGEAQKLLIKKTKMEISLYRLEMCAKQAKLGVTFKPNTPSAITCEDIVVNIPPNQVIPHSHKIAQ